MDSWNDFIFTFCKVEFLCWHGEPNWLGWVAMVYGVLLIVAVPLKTLLLWDK